MASTTIRPRRPGRAPVLLALVAAFAVTLIAGAAPAAAEMPAGARHVVSAPAPADEVGRSGSAAAGLPSYDSNTPPTGHPTATPVPEEPERPLVGMFRAALIAAMIAVVAFVIGVVQIARRVKRRRR